MVPYQKFSPERLAELYQPAAESHKGSNGKLLVIGGSKLFHASIFWSAEVASKMVDLVHFTSPAMENNELVRVKAKEKLWSGIVVPYDEVEKYIEEDEVVLIGPGMPREEGLMAGERPTKEIVDALLAKYPEKRWVVDGGALQECELGYLKKNMIITPHQGEWERLTRKATALGAPLSIHEQLRQFSIQHDTVTVLLKGHIDLVCQGEEMLMVAGGNAGLTKGGTGDVLAGLVAALYCKNEAMLAAAAASLVVKKAGEQLAKRVGGYFSAGDVVGEIPMVLGQFGRTE